MSRMGDLVRCILGRSWGDYIVNVIDWDYDYFEFL